MDATEGKKEANGVAASPPEEKGVKEEDDAPREAPFVREGATSTGATSDAPSTTWAGDSNDDDPKARTAVIDHDDVETETPPQNHIHSPWGNDSSSDDDGRVTSTSLMRVLPSRSVGGQSEHVVSTRWGEDSDDNDDSTGDDKADNPPLTSLTPSSGLMTAIDIDGEEAPAAQGQGGAWDSTDDSLDVFGFRSSRFAQPSRMAAAAAGVGSTEESSRLITSSTSLASASWGCDDDEEECDSDDDDDPFFPSLYPSRVNAHHRRDGSGNVVVAPLWMPHAQGRSGLDEPDHSWADEDEDANEGDGNDTNLRGTGDRNRVLMGGLQHRGTNATRPVFDDIDLTGRDDDSLRAENFAATHPERSATPMTTAPSPWFATSWNFRRQSPPDNDGSGDRDGRYRWSSQTASTPRRDNDWRNLHPISNAVLPRRSDASVESIENSPMHDTLSKGDTSAHQSSALLPARENRSWVQRASRSMRRLRSRAVKELGPPRDRNGRQEKKHDDDSGVLAWKWWDNFKNAPGLAGRLAVCILAVCALWSTSLNLVVDVTSQVIPSPTLTAVITAVVHAYYIVQEAREASVDCVARQSLYCDADIATFEVLARDDSVSSLSSTAATFEQASTWTESCQASVRGVEVSVKTWLAQGVGHTLLFSDTDSSNSTVANSTSSGSSGSSGSSNGSEGGSSSSCSSTDRELVADFLGDVSPGRDDLDAATTDFTLHSTQTVVALSSFALERSTYDAGYIANFSTQIAVDAQALIENVTFEVPDSIAESLQEISALGETLVSCVSLRGAGDGDDDGSGGSPCPVESARELADYARLQLDFQLEAARAGFQEYADVFDEYITSAVEAYNNWISFYNGVLGVLEANRIELAGEAWMELNAADFAIVAVELPSANGVLTGFNDALTSAEIWDSVSEAFGNYSDGVASRSAQITAEVDALQEEWYSLADEALANITVEIIPADYDPPLYGNASTEGGSSDLLGSTGPDFQAAADGYYSSSLALLNGLGPAAPNLSFPVSPSLNSTLVVGSASTVISSPIDYSFAAFTGTAARFEDWVVSIGNLALLLLAADYIFRTTSSLRLFVRFWGRGGLGLPDADVRIDKTVASAGGIIAGTRKALVRVLLHPATTVVFFGCVISLVLYNFASLYSPLFADYRAGCVEKTQNGSFFSQNVYSIAYNYAADQGNRDQWNYQEDHTSRRGALCIELSTYVRQYLTETDAQLRTMYESHYDDVTTAAILGACIDTAGMDALYAEACCGHDGSNNDTCSAATANSTLLQCPLNYASGVGEEFTPLQTALSDPACSAETLETANWKVEDGIALDCDTIPTCRLTCSGPNEELLRIVTTHAGCMIEWYFHASTFKLAATLLMFLFLNLSRVVLVGGIVKLNWRRLHPGIFTYKGTCTRAGELVVKNPEGKAGKGKPGVAAAAAAAAAAKEASSGGGGKSPLARARSRFGAREAAKTTTPSTSRSGIGEEESKARDGGWGGKDGRSTSSEGKRTLFGALGRVRGRDANPKAFASPGLSSKKGGAVDQGDGGGKKALLDAAGAGAAAVAPPDVPQEQPMTFKRVISGAVEEGLGKYENGARWRILLGVLLNIPWMLVLWFGRGSNTAYVAD